MEQIVILYLNEIGRKAFNANTKEIMLTGDITDSVINEKFPLELVERYEVKESFLNLKKDEYVCVVDADNNRHLGIVNQIYYKQIMINTTEDIPGHGGCRWFEFKPNGLEATRAKAKMHIERITDEEVEQMKEKLKNIPYINAVKTLLDGNTVALNYCDDIKMPEWLSFDTIEKILKLLSDDLDVFDENC